MKLAHRECRVDPQMLERLAEECAAERSVAERQRRAPDVAATHIETEIAHDPVSVKLQGHTVDIQALTRFMKDLESSPFLSNVQLDRSELALELGKEVTQFQLTVGYNRPDTSAVRRAPLALPVR